jgi:hypothetical protein
LSKLSFPPDTKIVVGSIASGNIYYILRLQQSELQLTKGISERGLR